MKKIALLIFLVLYFLLALGQETSITILDKLKTEYCNYEKTDNSHTCSAKANSTLEIKAIGNSNGYKIQLSSRYVPSNLYCSKGAFQMFEESNRVVLDAELSQLFSDIVLKYYEWYSLAKTKNLDLTKTMLERNRLGQADVSHYNGLMPDYMGAYPGDFQTNRNQISKENYYNIKVIYENNELHFSCSNYVLTKFKQGSPHKEYKKSASIIFDYYDLLPVKKIIENGDFKTRINELNNAEKSWSEFKGID